MSEELVKKDFTAEQIDLITKTVAPGLTKPELQLYLYQAAKTGLDPLARQIHAVKRSNRVTIQTSIDGYRLIADRTGKYAGNDDPVYQGDNNGFPIAATVTVWKIVNGVRCPFTATARWSEYFPGEQQGFMWKKMPHLMIGKCAEALALRKAFPAELSGLYTNEEMEQAEIVEVKEIKDDSPAKRKVEFLKRCETAKHWFELHNDAVSYGQVLGQSGVTEPDEVNEKNFQAIEDAFRIKMQDILDREKQQKNHEFIKELETSDESVQPVSVG